MSSVIKNEFLSLMKGVKSIIIIMIFVLFSYYISDFFSVNSQLVDNKEAAYSSIRFLVFVLGYLFSSILSHNTINKEIELKTVRLVITKISRTEFWLGKYLGNILFWLLCLTISYVVISFMSNQIDIEIYIMILGVMQYFVSFVLLMSTLIEKTSLSNFLGLIFGLGVPIFGLWVTLTKNPILGFIKYIFPYYYILKGGFYIIIPVGISIMMIGIALMVFKKKEL